MLIISLLLSAIFFLVTKFTKPFCVFATASSALILCPLGAVSLAQGVPTLAPPDPNETASTFLLREGGLGNETEPDPKAISAPPLLVPQSIDQSNRFRSSTSETLPPPSGANSSQTGESNSGQILNSPAETRSNVQAISEAKRAWSLSKEQHPWARFPNGAWRTFRIESESFDDTGISLGRNTTIRTETLTYVGNNYYQLQVSTQVDIGGKRLPSAPQEVTLDLLTDGLVQPSSIEKQGTTSISLQGQAVPCTIWDLITPLTRGERHELVYYSAERAPYVLRRERIDSIEGQDVGRKTSNIVRDGMPVMVGETLQPARHLLVTEQLVSGGNRECFEIHSDRIPGSLIESSEIDYGPTGQRFRWATTELIGAGLQQGVPLFSSEASQVPSLRTPQLRSPRLTFPQSRSFQPNRLPLNGMQPNAMQPNAMQPGPSQRQVPQLQPSPNPQLPRRGNRRESDERDRDDDDDDDRDDRDDDDDDDEIKPRRLLRLLRRAEVYLPLEVEPGEDSESL